MGNKKEVDLLQKQIVHYLRTHRLARNMSQSDLAACLGVTRNVICAYEKIGEESRITHSLGLFGQIAELENLSISEFFRRIDSQNTNESPWVSAALGFFNMLVLSNQVALKKSCQKFSPCEVNTAVELLLGYLSMGKPERDVLRQLCTVLSNREVQP